MKSNDNHVHLLLSEYQALGRDYGAVQLRCSRVISEQRALIDSLESQAVRLRGHLLMQMTALQIESEVHAHFKASMGALPGESAQHLDAIDSDTVDLDRLDASLAAADLVICQTGCLSHGVYWRVEDHCKRTGKSCVLVEQPKAIRIVRIRQGVN